ncbi:MAG TPA: patatin-like phospholipase family protein [Stellaceae bacterium]|jgi:NTE family protein|nr:patatin-like phospholipase family protein [Stellaceae bacterium]
MRGGWLLILWLLAGCAGTHFENTPLQAGDGNPDRRSILPANPDRPVILMTFSGGGSRAAALAEAVLREMAATSYLGDDGRHVLTEDVKLVSSVSGGSVTAGWFGLHRSPGHWDGDLDTLRTDFLVEDNMKALELDVVNPVTWFGMVTGKVTAIEALERLFNERLFHDQPLAALNQRGKPYIVLNATDMAGGQSFAMVPRRFDDVCSKYDTLPIASAVAASAAFPVLLTPVSFINYSVGCQGQVRNGSWVKNDLSNPYTAYLNLPEYRDARYTNDLRHGPNAFRNIDYLYFLDGGLADNLGTQSLRAALIAPYDDAGILRAINEGRIRRLAVIVVNARADPPNKLYQQRQQPDLINQIEAVSSVPIDANTANSQTALSALLGELAQAAATGSGKFGGMSVYGITVDYDQIPVDTPAHRALRDRAKTVPTRWSLTPAQLQVTEEAGRFLLRRHPCWRALLADLGTAEPPLAGEEPAPNMTCPTKSEMAKSRGRPSS